MKKVAKNLFILLATVITICALSVVASAEVYGDLLYTVENGEVTITDCRKSATEIVIPDEINGYPVTKIGISAFDYCESLKNVIIGNNVTSIMRHAFKHCHNLENVTIGNSVNHIGDYAFGTCSTIENITIPDSVTSIGDSAFSDCRNLINITIPDSVTSIGYDAFENTAFYNNSDNWTDGVLYIDNYLLASKDISECVIKDGTTLIADRVFSNRKFLTSVTIPDSVTNIGDSAFYGCISLPQITIPDSITSIGDSAFSGCTDLTSLYITDITAWCNIEFEGFNSNPMSYAENLYINNELITKLVIPDSATSIGDYAFYGYTGLTSVTIGDSVTSIGYQAFGDCTGLTSVTIGNSVTSIDSYAFSNCTGLTKINWNAKNVKDCVSSDGYNPSLNVFYNAGTKGAGIEVIFSDNVERIPAYLFSVSDYHYSPKVTSVTIGESVTSIGNSAFDGCTGLTSVIIPDSVTSIGYQAFGACTGLTKINWNAKNTSDFDDSIAPFVRAGEFGAGIEVIFGDNVEKIPGYLFYVSVHPYEAKVTSVTIGNSVTSIGKYAFYWCRTLESVTIGESVTSIGSHAFYNCDAITDVCFTGTEKEWQQINIEEGNDAILNAKPQTAFVLGDVNGDNQITAEDARLALRLSAGLETFEELKVSVAVVDYNCDKQITAEDARRILRKSAGLE